MNGVFEVLQSLVRGESVSDSYAEVVEILTSLRDGRNEIAVQFAGDNHYYPSLVTAVSPHHRIMTIKDSIPAAPSALVKDNPVTIKAQKQGRELIFESRFIEPLVADVSLGYQVTIPERLGTSKPRQAFRVLLDEIRNRVRITLQGPELQEIDGTVRDISRLGIGMKTESELPRFLSQYFLGGSQTVGCQIDLDREKSISCMMEIRNVHAVASDRHATLIGGRILDLTQKDSNLLANFVSSLKREQLRAYA
ncbi:MAG: PilZ domain-containing protein [Gammaproteobacteria bacterium]|nr:PilZ domain-containing protein [Pseudomonadales bacterium]MCP5348235.1 PilZ domain-containing protein [Pseudomonadales bacterium]